MVIAGPCAVESREQVFAAARAVKAAGARVLRGGAFKPRTGPHSFQGMGFEGLEILAEAGREVGLPVVTEVMRIDQLERVAAAWEMSRLIQTGNITALSATHKESAPLAPASALAPPLAAQRESPWQ